MKVDINTLKKYKGEGWLKSQVHPELPLTIWNYTNQTQYEGKWDEITTLCRGLVTDREGNVIAHPLKKFFNYGELKDSDIPDEPFLIYEKLDGSYIQVFSYQDEFVVTSKGSFTSDQVEMATEILNQRFSDWAEIFNPDYNYIFELIHPQNRIVVDYGNKKDLVLLAVIVNETGDDFDFFDVEYEEYFSTPMSVPMLSDSWEGIRQRIQDNEEGFVVVFNSGFRMKLKGDEYLRLHRIVTHTSSKDIWLALKEQRSLQELIDRTPDEWQVWVYKTIGELYVKRRTIMFQLIRDLAYGQEKGLYLLNGDLEILQTHASRKDIAIYFNTCQYPSLMFSILNERFPDDKIWDMVRPKHEKGFSI